MSSLVDFFFVIPHLLGQNPDRSLDEVLAEIERRTGMHVSASQRAELEALWGDKHRESPNQ